VEDVVAANLAASAAPHAAGLTANVGSGERHSLLDLLGAVGEAAGRALDPVFEAPRPGDVRDSQADISLAAERLAFRPSVGLAEGIRRTLTSYRETAALAHTAGG